MGYYVLQAGDEPEKSTAEARLRPGSVGSSIYLSGEALLNELRRAGVL